MFRKHLEAVLNSKVVRNDPVCQRILGEVPLCSENDDLFALLERLTARLTDIQEGNRIASNARPQSSRAQGRSRMTLRL